MCKLGEALFTDKYVTNYKYCVVEFNGRRLYAEIALDYKLTLWGPTLVSRAVSAVSELLVTLFISFCLCVVDYAYTVVSALRSVSHFSINVLLD